MIAAKKVKIETCPCCGQSVKVNKRGRLVQHGWTLVGTFDRSRGPSCLGSTGISVERQERRDVEL